MSGVEHVAYFGADSAHHLVRITWWEMADDGEPSHHSELLSPADALGLAGNLIVWAGSALESQVADAAAGDCVECSNLRLVDRQRPGGSTESVRCPNCGDRYKARAVPTMPGWADTEAKMLGR